MLLFVNLAVSGWQVAVIVLVIVLLFGGRKIPELMKGIGSGIKEFKNASKEEDSDKKENKNKDASKA